jgi:hypothetical protein
VLNVRFYQNPSEGTTANTVGFVRNKWMLWKKSPRLLSCDVLLIFPDSPLPHVFPAQTTAKLKLQQIA